jgi:DNA-binding transcriptional LysR family regulator
MAMATTLLLTTRLRRYVRHGTLRQLAALEAVATLGSVTHAAEALCIAQPTLSGQLRKLGDALGVRLFAQHGKRLVPTDAAQAVLQAAREVFEALQRCEATISPLREAGQQRDPGRSRPLQPANLGWEGPPWEARLIEDPMQRPASELIDTA